MPFLSKKNKGEQSMKSARTKWIAAGIAVVLILAVAAGMLFTFDHFVIVEGHL